MNPECEPIAVTREELYVVREEIRSIYESVWQMRWAFSSGDSRRGDLECLTERLRRLDERMGVEPPRKWVRDY